MVAIDGADLKQHSLCQMFGRTEEFISGRALFSPCGNVTWLIGIECGLRGLDIAPRILKYSINKYAYKIIWERCHVVPIYIVFRKNGLNKTIRE